MKPQCRSHGGRPILGGPGRRDPARDGSPEVSCDVHVRVRRARGEGLSAAATEQATEQSAFLGRTIGLWRRAVRHGGRGPLANGRSRRLGRRCEPLRSPSGSGRPRFPDRSADRVGEDGPAGVRIVLVEPFHGASTARHFLHRRRASERFPHLQVPVALLGGVPAVGVVVASGVVGGDCGPVLPIVDLGLPDQAEVAVDGVAERVDIVRHQPGVGRARFGALLADRA